MKTAQELFEAAFSTPRTKRSAEYKGGVLALLRHKMEDAHIRCPYVEGTAGFDAWHSGLEEGWSIFEKVGVMKGREHSATV